MYKLLIVDDEPLVCVGVQSMLDWAAMDVEVIGTARNGGQAEEIIAKKKPDIVVTDIKMPVKDGLQLARESSDKNGPVPVFIMLTSFEEFEYARQALQAKAVDYLIKMELDAARLKAAVSAAIAAVERGRAALPGVQQLARSSMQALREKFFIRLFNDLFDNDETREAQINDLELDFSCSGFAVASCKLNLPRREPVGAKDHLSLFHNAMRRTRETLARHLKCYVVPLDMIHFTIVFCLEDKEREDYRLAVKRALRQTTDALLDYIGIQMYSSFGSLVESPRQLGLSYRQAQRRIHGLTADNPTAIYEKSPDPTVAYAAQIQGRRREIRKAFEELDTVALNDALTQIADTFDQRQDDLLEIMDAACNILYMAISLLPEGEAMLNGIFGGAPDGYRSLYQMRDTKSIAAWVRQLRDGCME